MDAAVQWIAFVVLSAVAIGGALGMTTTMGMFRSGIFLMASFFGVAGLFLLLSADLLGWLTVMMYVGGMLVMILFMVLVSADPGGDMMTSMMKLSGPEKLFSLGLERAAVGGDGHARADGGGGGHAGQDGGADGAHHGGGDDQDRGGHQGHGGGMGGMSHEDMAMFTPAKRWAAGAALVLGAALVALVVWRPAFPTVNEAPDPASAKRVGKLLMGKYMMAFEGAGLMILLGVYGGVLAARPGRHTGARDRRRLEAASEAEPEPIGGGAAAPGPHPSAPRPSAPEPGSHGGHP